jgi:glycosyltransferase involved in cell wall biosynthesis
LLANNPVADTGYGIDRYCFELSERVRRYFNLTILSQGTLSNILYWGVKEIILPIKTIPVRADVYHAASPQLAKAALLFHKFPLVTTFHDLIPIKESLTSFYQKKLNFSASVRFQYLRICSRIAVRSDILIAPFEVTRRDLISTLGVNPNKIRIISYGVNTNRFRPLKLSNNMLKKKEGKKIVLFVGGFSTAKGTDVLMEAFKTVVEKFSKVELWICGKWFFFDGIKLAKNLGILEHIRFLGHIPEDKLPIYYNLADVVVMPSKIGFCLPILEGMACKKAIITSDTPDIKEIVGDSVITVFPNDVDKLAELICYVLTDEALREELAYKAYQKANCLSWDNIAKKTMDVYLELVNNE